MRAGGRREGKRFSTFRLEGFSAERGSEDSRQAREDGNISWQPSRQTRARSLHKGGLFLSLELTMAAVAMGPRLDLFLHRSESNPSNQDLSLDNHNWTYELAWHTSIATRTAQK